MLPNGTMKFSDVYLHAIKNKFCMETTLNPYKNKLEEVAVVCFPAPSFTPHWYYFVGLLISILFLALTLFVYFMLPELQNLHGKTVMCHTASFLLAYICLALVKRPLTKYEPVSCSALGKNRLISIYCGL